jgi:hypothetical protein
MLKSSAKIRSIKTMKSTTRATSSRTIGSRARTIKSITNRNKERATINITTRSFARSIKSRTFRNKIAITRSKATSRIKIGSTIRKEKDEYIKCKISHIDKVYKENLTSF